MVMSYKGNFIKENSEIFENEYLEIINLLNENVSFGLMNKEKLVRYIKDDKIIVLRNESEVIGVVSLIKIDDYKEKIRNRDNILMKLGEKGFGESGEVYTIDLLVVKKSYRNNGYGKMLIKEALKNCEGKDVIRFIWLNTENELRLNYMLGDSFIKIGEIEDYWYGDDVYCPYCKNNCRCSVAVAINKIN